MSTYKDLAAGRMMEGGNDYNDLRIGSLQLSKSLRRHLARIPVPGMWNDQANDLGEIDMDLPLALVVGHEGQGLRRLVRANCDFLLKLPMKGRVESLNAAVAGSIVLYTAMQARDSSHTGH